jgi:hypothetical protein
MIRWRSVAARDDGPRFCSCPLLASSRSNRSQVCRSIAEPATVANLIRPSARNRITRHVGPRVGGYFDGATARTRHDRADRDRICCRGDRTRGKGYPRALPPSPRRRVGATCHGGDAGILRNLTRAVIFLLFGVILGIAALDSDSREAVGLAGVLRAVQHQSNGGILLGIAAVGLLAFGFFEIIEAATRHAAAVTSSRQE